MNQPLDDLYLRWLYEFVADGSTKVRSRTYWTLTKQLYSTEYACWLVRNDDNRAEDGRCLRYEFIDGLGLHDVDPDWLMLGCSMLELLVGLSRRLSFFADGEPADWFWHLINNLGIRYNDREVYPQHSVTEALERINLRQYSKDGSGGLFPLRHTKHDQTRVELWYQMNEYLLERT